MKTIQKMMPCITIFCLSISLFSCNLGAEKAYVETPPPSMSDEEYILKGKYLTTIGGCNDCHTPKIFTEQGMMLDTSRLLSGHPAGTPLPPIDPKSLEPGGWVLFNSHSTASVGPWGLTYAQNLTPHETGIKNWQEEYFIKSMRIGKHMGIEMGRPVMPPMPWMNLAQAEEDDLIAIFRYLKSLKPIENHVPEPISPEGVLNISNAL